MTEQRRAGESSAGKLSDETVGEIVARILGVCRPEQVILFGSAATGRMTRDSDIDILVVLNDVTDARREAMRVRPTAFQNTPNPPNRITATAIGMMYLMNGFHEGNTFRRPAPTFVSSRNRSQPHAKAV